MAIAALISGIISLIAWIIPLFGLPVSATGLVLGILSLSSSKGLAITGIVLSSIGLLLTIVNASIGAYKKHREASEGSEGSETNKASKQRKKCEYVASEIPKQWSHKANELKSFIETLIKEAGLDKMPADFLEEYGDKLLVEANKRMGVTAMAELEMEEIVELNELIEQGHEKAIGDYLASHIEGFEGKMKKALGEFRLEVLAAAGKA